MALLGPVRALRDLPRAVQDVEPVPPEPVLLRPLLVFLLRVVLLELVALLASVNAAVLVNVLGHVAGPLLIRLARPWPPGLLADPVPEWRVRRVERELVLRRLLAWPLFRFWQPPWLLLLVGQAQRPVVATVVPVVLEPVALRPLLLPPAGAEKGPHLLRVHVVVVAYALVPFPPF